MQFHLLFVLPVRLPFPEMFSVPTVRAAFVFFPDLFWFRSGWLFGVPGPPPSLVRGVCPCLGPEVASLPCSSPPSLGGP